MNHEVTKEWLQAIGLIFLYVLLFSILASVCHAQSREEVELTIREMAHQNHIDEELALAIAEVESGMNPNAVGSLGELGVFQLRPEFHDVKPGAVLKNTATAMKYMARIQKACSHYGDAWFVCWNLGPNYKRLKYPRLFPYYDKVMDARRKLADR